MKYFLRKCIILPTALVLTIFSATACLGSDAKFSTTISNTKVLSASVENTGLAEDIEASYSEKDLDTTWDDSTAVHISLAETAITADKQEGIAIDGNTLTISAAGTYVISGALNDGQIVIDAADKDDIHLILQNASITNSKTSPIYIKNADKTIITLPDGTANSISDGKEYTFVDGEDEPDAAVFSTNDLTINGNGKLIVNGNYRNGIATKDDLVIVGGSIEVTAVNDAIRGRDSVTVKDGKLTLTAGGDGIKANQDADSGKGYIILDGGDYEITAQNDGIQAETLLKINGGNYTICTGGGSENAPVEINEHMNRGNKHGDTPPTMDGTENAPPNMRSGNKGIPPNNIDGAIPITDGTEGRHAQVPEGEEKPATIASTNDEAITSETTKESAKGLKATNTLIINGGTFNLDTADDAIHSNGTVSINDGNLIIATGDDGIHSDNNLIINDGTIAIGKSYEGIEGATISINGGDINIISSDDGINAAGNDDESTQDPSSKIGQYWIRITKGTITIDAGGDGIDSNGDFYQEGGDIIIKSTANRGDSPLDYDGECSITGGTMSPAVSSNKNQPLA